MQNIGSLLGEYRIESSVGEEFDSAGGFCNHLKRGHWGMVEWIGSIEACLIHIGME